MNDPSILTRYALALHLVPDPDAAADLFMEARDEADLRRRAMTWRASRQLPPPPDGPLPELDDDLQAHARHLARRSRLRRRMRPVLAALAAMLVLVSIGVLAHDLRGPVDRAQAETPELKVTRGPLPVQSLVGTLLPVCDGVELVESAAGPLELTLYLPYNLAGDPYIAQAFLESLPRGAQPGKIALEVRADDSQPVVGGCYRLTSTLVLPPELKGRPVTFAVNIRHDAWRVAHAFHTEPVYVPHTR